MPFDGPEPHRRRIPAAPAADPCRQLPQTGRDS